MVCGVTGGLYTILGLDPHPFVNLVLTWGPTMTVVLWLQRDIQRTGVGAVQDVEWFLMMGWLVAIPWYSLKTRGRAGWRLIVRLFGYVASPYIGALVALVAFALLRALTGR